MAKNARKENRKGSSRQKGHDQNLDAILQLSVVEKRRFCEEPIQDIQDIVIRHDSWQEAAIRQGKSL